MKRRPLRGASRELKAAARGLRRGMTEAERVLWESLRGGATGVGARFRRQHPIGTFILDFYCASHKLCIEVDGGIHDEQKERDAARDEALLTLGIRTLRIRNEEVLTDMPSVLSRIEKELAHATIPNPLPLAGEGGEPERAG